jgi:hypothetical protein
MRTHTPFILAVLVACAAPVGSETDAGTKTDSGTNPPQDSGTPPQDSGKPPPPTDSGGPPPPCTQPLIDDMEHADGSILSNCNRVGFWFTFNDATTSATQTPAQGANFLPSLIPNGGRGSSTHAAHTTGSGFTVWGAGMGFDLNDQGGSSTKQTYDASNFTGFTFWVMAGQGGATTVRFNVPTKATDPAGNLCSPAAKCNDHFGTTVQLTMSWTQVTINFSQLQQLGWGTPATFQASQVYGVEFQFDPNKTFDLWVDDISFK